ncbi:hypothetical protein ERX37_00655 [Macrococcus hajekii]|uniref:Uncharacterized protein n=1 Tax=Macrococcus hajekii TaxID=198482 RepID=A0A4R6BLG6_9STAP|nr:hypothetical protein [Macrococcus hajekii]TDM02630.1 hypothetical protein ERX37_00655 [Macrococcus hajekii]GGB02612.1 hypothetical protein GCM10007190_08230 [Macrococcus hajekii]
MPLKKELLQEMKAIKEHHYRSRTAYNYYYSRYDQLKSRVNQYTFDEHPVDEQLEQVETKPLNRTKHHVLADYLAEEQKPIRSYAHALAKRKHLSDLEHELQIILLEEFLTEVNAKLG